MSEHIAVEMIRVRHRFIDHKMNPETETLIIGTFNPFTTKKQPHFFYATGRNDLWTLLPKAFGEASLKGSALEEKLRFIREKRIDFVDLISEVEVQEGTEIDRGDDYIDDKVTEWRDVIRVIDNLRQLKRVCFTRRTFSRIPNMEQRVREIVEHCQKKTLCFEYLVTPSKAYRGEDKQEEWNRFFNPSSPCSIPDR
jgi:G:T/U-mismatch repair DNA glycosylase